MQGEEEHGDGVKAAGSLWAAIRTIIIADAVMSLDNAIAIAAAAKGDTTLIVLGLLISIPLIIFGATLIMLLLEPLPDHRHRRRRPAGLDRGRSAGDRSGLCRVARGAMPNAKTWFEIGGAVLTVALGYWLQRRARAKKHEEPVDLAAEGRKE